MQSFQDRSVYCPLVDPLEFYPFGGLGSITDLSILRKHIIHPTDYCILCLMYHLFFLSWYFISAVDTAPLDFSFLTLLP